MAVNKVVYNTENGAEVLIDLTNDSVTPETLAEGATAHDASGNTITGTLPTDNVRYGKQTLTEAQKAQARMNIGAIDEAKLEEVTNGIVIPTKTSELTNDSGFIRTSEAPTITLKGVDKSGVTHTWNIWGS